MLQKSACFVVLFIISILLSACGGTNPGSGGGVSDILTDPESGGIKGYTVGSSSRAISGILVEAGNKQTFSDANGAFLLYPLPAGDYNLTGRAAGYSPAILSGIRVFRGTISENIILKLEPEQAAASAGANVKAVSPMFGTDGDEVTVIGYGFGLKTGRVTFAGKEGIVTDWNTKNDGAISVRLPFEVESGNIRVYVNGIESIENPPILFVARPVAVEATPAIAKSGAIVYISGRNFHEVGSYNKVFLNGKECQVRSATTRQLEVVLPQNAGTGILQVSINSNTYQLEGISTAKVTVPPVLTKMSPQRSIPGVKITLTGENFGESRESVTIKIANSKILGSTDLLSFSPTQLSFTAPGNSVLEPGLSAQVKVLVNDVQSNALVYTSFDTALSTVNDYGIYDFSAVASSGIMRLPKLDTHERLALLSVFAGNGTVDLTGSYSYVISATMGGNTSSNFTANVKGFDSNNKQRLSTSKFFDAGLFVRNLNRQKKSGQNASIRKSISEPPPATASFWLVNFASTAPGNSENDVLATGTLVSSSEKSLVYLDIATDTSITQSEAAKTAEWFDNIYNTLATACWDGVSAPPEGNIDSQPKIVLFLSPQLNRGVTSELVALGYFNSRDKDSSAYHSAGTEILYLWDQAQRDNIDDFKGLLAHELQHLFYYNQKGNEGVTWLDEGLSVFAQQVAGYGFSQGMTNPIDQVSEYLRNPYLVSLNQWPDDSGLENYGMSFLFVQYLFERCGGYTAIKALEKKNGITGFNDVESNIIRSMSVPNAASLQDFYSEWGLTLYCDDLDFPVAMPGYKSDVYLYKNIALRKSFTGLMGIRHLSFDENAVSSRILPIPGYGFDIIEYSAGNGGDIEVSFPSIPVTDGKTFKTWVIYYPE
ncbi:MAG: IPT/TIG domain-containing protein [Candidatus Riflebacteria bacterium]|nr:IPT/TIG domain-containing protein [Candidatus Riflebacteria bacterium]